MMTMEVGQQYTDKDGREWRQCPYDGCDGSPLDFVNWREFRSDHPAIPATPEKGKVYPLYD
ncbi:MAG: hypothetical protein ACYSU0_16480 [Planctomycetota bacterium]